MTTTYKNNVILTTDDDIKSDAAFHVRFTKGYELMEKYPHHVPVLFSTQKGVLLENNTLMCSKESTLCNVIKNFRKNLVTQENSPSSGFIFCIKTDGKLVIPKMTEKLGDLHQRHHCSDMWLTIQIDKEDIFG